MNKKLIITFILTSFALAGCSAHPPHEHTFSNEWEHNESCHYHPATCEHKEFTKDMMPHSYVEGVCSVCGYVDPNYKPDPKPYVDKYFLPSEYKQYYGDTLMNKTTYSYENNAKTYTETRYIYAGDFNFYTKEVSKYSYSDDYSTCELFKDEYIVDNAYELLISSKKYEYEFYSNSSYKETRYDYDDELEEYVFDKTIVKLYNDKKQLLTTYTLKSAEVEGSLYYTDITQYVYDQYGNTLKALYFSGKYNSEYVTYLESFDEYFYSEDYSTGRMNSYYYSEDGYLLDSYTEITREYIDDIRYDTEQIYYPSGEKGNKNKFGYDSNLERVYTYYGGFPEETSIKKNEYNQIYNYVRETDDLLTTMDVTYQDNGGNILSSTKVTSDFSDSFTESSTYSYNETNQIKKVENVVTGLVNESSSCEISYSTIKNDALLMRMSLYGDIIRNFSDNCLVEGI